MSCWRRWKGKDISLRTLIFQDLFIDVQLVVEFTSVVKLGVIIAKVISLHSYTPVHICDHLLWIVNFPQNENLDSLSKSS